MDKKRAIRAWACCLTIFLVAAVCAALNYKVAACMPLLMQSLNTTEAGAGLFITSVSLVGVIIGIPVGNWIVKYRPRKVGIICLIVMALGNLMGALVSDYTLILISRFFEGFGFGTIAVIGSTFNAMWFPPEKRGLPSGVLSIWVGCGMSFIIATSTFFFVEDPMVSWHNVWWYSFVLCIAALVLFIIFCREPGVTFLEQHGEGISTEYKATDVFKSAPLVLIAVGFCVICFGSVVLTSFASSYSVVVLGTDASLANELTSSRGIWMVASGLLVGFALNRLKRLNQRVIFMVVLIFINSVVYVFMFQWQISWAAIFMAVSGLALGAPMAVMWSLVPEMAPRPELTGAASGVLAVAQALGGVLAGSVGGMIIASIGYGPFTYVAVAIAVAMDAGIIVFYFLMKRKFGAKFTSSDPYGVSDNLKILSTEESGC